MELERCHERFQTPDAVAQTSAGFAWREPICLTPTQAPLSGTPGGLPETGSRVRSMTSFTPVETPDGLLTIDESRRI